jgi:hypothetical protein
VSHCRLVFATVIRAYRRVERDAYAKRENASATTEITNEPAARFRVIRVRRRSSHIRARDADEQRPVQAVRLGADSGREEGDLRLPRLVSLLLLVQVVVEPPEDHVGVEVEFFGDRWDVDWDEDTSRAFLRSLPVHIVALVDRPE